MSDEAKFVIEFYRPEGDNHYRVIFTDTRGRGHKFALNSPMVDNLDDKEQRRFVLDNLFGVNPAPFAQVIRQRLFPSDTRVYDKVETVHGVKLMNPRYPEEQICQNQQ